MPGIENLTKLYGGKGGRVIEKRRRLDSEATAGDASQSRTPLLEEICRQGFGEIGRRLDRIEQRLDGMGSRLDRIEQPSQQDNGQRDELGQRMGCVEERVASVEEKLETGLIELTDNIENQMADVKENLEHSVLVSVEDEMGIAQGHFEDFVANEVRSVGEDIEESVMERLRDALS